MSATATVRGELLRLAKRPIVQLDPDGPDDVMSVRVQLLRNGQVLGAFVVQAKVSEVPDLAAVDVRPPAPASSPAWRWLCPTSEKVTAFLTASHARDPLAWVTAEQIAEGVGMPCSGEFRCLLRMLVERGILESLQRHGYRLNLPAAAPEPAEAN
jgi:hypothetical protein